MTGVFKTVTFFVLVFATTLVFAEDYDVGDDTEWTLPTVMEFYDTWASGKTFRVGDELEFEFAAGRHDVAVVTQAAYDDCDKTQPLSIFKTSPVKIVLNTTGPHYYICTIAEHCRFGQKLAIDVVAAGGAGGGGGAGAGGAAPGGPSTGPGAGGAAPITPGAAPTTPAADATPATPAGGATPTTPAGTTATPSGGNVASSLGGATYLAAFVSAVVALF